MSKIYVGLIGLGNIGTGVANYLMQNGEKDGLELKCIAVRDVSKGREIYHPSIRDDVNCVLDDEEINIVVELVGGDTFDCIRRAMARGKNVVTANKAVVAKRGREIFDYARGAGVDFGFEASVGGGIPIVGTLMEYLSGDNVRKLIGIVNGTTNYILTRMSEGMTYEEALLQAQEKGFAETDPYLDVSGEDARQKLSILSSIAWNSRIDPASISCQGITKITPTDFDYARSFGYTIKLLATGKKHNGVVELRVSPSLIPNNHPLASVNDEFNAVYVEGDLCGPQSYSGRGAGRGPTTNAVISDIRRIARNIRSGTTADLPRLDQEIDFVKDPVSSGYFRMNLFHTPGTFGRVANILGRNGINIRDSIQRREYGYEVDGQIAIPDIMTIEPIEDSFVHRALEELQGAEVVHGKPYYLRIEE